MKMKTVLVLTLILLAAAGIPAVAQQSQAANGRAAHVGLPVDWSFRQVMHHSANTPEFTDAAQAEPRVLYNWMYRNSKNGATPNAQASHGRLKVHPPTSLKVDWNAPLGIGTLAPNMFPAKYTFDPNATPSCSTDYVVYALNVQGSAAQPNLVAFNNLYSGPTTTFNIGAPSGGATESGNVVTITTTATHNFTAGQSITIAGVTDTRYNGVFTVLASPAPTATKFSYTSTFSALPASGNGTASFFAFCGTATPSIAWAYNTATSNGTAVAINASPTGAIEAGSTVTITAPAHGLAAGQKVVISGVGVGGFNGYFTVATVPTANTFTYTNTSTGLAVSGGGTVTLAKSTLLTSPLLSLDGTKVAFVESVTTNGANDCGTGVAGPCSIFHVLTIGTTGSNGTFSGNNFTAVTPGSGNNASLTSLVYSSTTNTVSSAWYDYGRDNLYVGDDNGKVYQISCVFTSGCGSPAFAGGFSKDIGITVTSAATKLTAPVLFTDPAGASSFKIFVGSSDGNLYMLPLGTCLPGAVANCVGKLTKAVGNGSAFGGIVDPPLVDPIFQTVFVGTGVATGGGNGGVVETNFALTTLGTLTAANTTYDVHQGALDNDYYLMNLNDATVKGHFYFAASGIGGGQLILNNAPFTKGAGNLTTANPPIFGAIASFNLTGHSTLPASPMTEVFSNGVDNLIFGQADVPKQGCGTAGTAQDGCMYRFNITSGTIPAAIDNNATQHGSPSGAVIDNVSTAAQASSVYFANGATTGASTTAPTCTVAGTTPAYCAVKLTQSALQ